MAEAEFRIDTTKAFIQKVDALCQARGLSRREWATPILEREIDREVHQATVLLRMIDGNADAPDRGRS